jgi:hypothetical protein
MRKDYPREEERRAPAVVDKQAPHARRINQPVVLVRARSHGVAPAERSRKPRLIRTVQKSPPTQLCVVATASTTVSASTN